MLVGFDCYLRVSELVGLRRCDVVMPLDPRMGRAHTRMAVVLPSAKTGLNQSVALQHQGVADLFAHWVRRLPGRRDSDLVFAFSDDYLRRLIRSACVALGLGVTPYVPHSLRHGGATADYLLTSSVEHVMFRGRWKSMESCRRYIQQARALLAAQRVPQQLNDVGALLGDHLPAVFAGLIDAVAEVTSRARGRRVRFH